jgi:hypothetical protein
MYTSIIDTYKITEKESNSTIISFTVKKQNYILSIRKILFFFRKSSRTDIERSMYLIL